MTYHSKYHAEKVKVDGQTYDSKSEFKRWIELSMLEKAGEIRGLRRQVRFNLIPTQKGADGKVIERPLDYIADFVYERNGKMVVEDVKSPITKTPSYIIKRKLMLYLKGIEVLETGGRRKVNKQVRKDGRVARNHTNGTAKTEKT